MGVPYSDGLEKGNSAMLKTAKRLLLIGNFIILVSCQSTGTVSVDEARKMAIEMSAQSYSPPPRTTSDIVALLEEYKPDPARLEYLRKKADVEPWESLPKSGLWRFYRERAGVAQLLGRPEQSVADYREALKVSVDLSIRKRRDLMREAGLVLAENGHFNEAVQVMTKSIQLMSNSVGNNEVMAQIQAQVGNIDEAERYANAALALLVRNTPNDPPQEFRDPTVRYIRASASGDLLQAEFYIRSSMQAYRDSSRKGHVVNWLEHRQQVLADNLMSQNRPVEAEAVLRDALISVLKKSGKYTLDTALLLQGLARALTLEDRYEEARALANEALEILKEMSVPDKSRLRGQAYRAIGKIETARGNWRAAAEIFDRADDALSDNDFFRNLLIVEDLDVSAARALTRSNVDGVSMLSARLKNLETDYGKNSRGAAEARGLLAMAKRNAGDIAGALVDFADSLQILISESADNGPSMLREKMIAEAYLWTLLDARKAGTGLADAADKVFQVMEIARGGVVRKALVANAARLSADPELADIIRQLQDAQWRAQTIGGYVSAMLATPADQQVDGVLDDLRQRLSKLRVVERSLFEEIEKRYPRYGSLVSPRPATVADVQSQLTDGEVMVQFFFGNDRGVVMAVSKGKLPQIAEIDYGQDTLAEKVSRIRAALAPEAVRQFSDMRAFDTSLAHQLYLELLAPVSAIQPETDHLLVVAHGAIGALPLGLLITKPTNVSPDEKFLFGEYQSTPWLARTHATSRLPSVASLTTLRTLPKGKLDRRPMIGFGDPIFAAGQTNLADAGVRGRRPIQLRATPQTRAVDSADLSLLPRLPDTRDELTAIGKTLRVNPARDLFFGLKANETIVKSTDLTNYRVVAFATHGLVSGDLNGLNEPALALSNPTLVDNKGDGLLTMSEVMNLRLNADWVILSACNTAAADGRGAEAVSGLGRAFFYAGTRALLVSNWPVETTSVKALTTDIFRRQAEDPSLSRAQALRRAMLGLMDGPGYVDDQGRTVFSYAHPIFWAPFTLIGDGGGSGPGA